MRNLNRSCASDQGQSSFKKRVQTQEESRSAKVKLEKGDDSQNGKPTCITCGKRHYDKCLRGTDSCFGCGKQRDKVRDSPTIVSIGGEGKKVLPNVPKYYFQAMRNFYALRNRGEKSDNCEDYEGKSLHFLLLI